MSKFTLSLMVAAVAGLSGSAICAANLADAANAAPKVTSASRPSADVAKAHRPARKVAKMIRTKSPDRKAIGKFAAADELQVIYSCSFDFLSEGTEAEPAALELDDWDNIPEDVIGEENYGFGGQGLMQAGGAVYVPFEYAEDPDDEDPWYMEGMLWTPDLYEAMEVTLELDAKIVEDSDIDSDELWVYASDYYSLLDSNYGEIDKEWKHLVITINATEFSPESDDDSYYFTLFADNGADIVMKNVEIKGKKPALEIPVALDYTDYDGTSFTAHWSEVEGATGYYLSVYNFDPSTKTTGAAILDAELVTDTQYTVTGLTTGNFYAYDVTATNGSFTTAASNTVVVCELTAPTGVTLAGEQDNKSLFIYWEATPGANYYVLNVESSREVAADQTVMLADADFSSVESTGTVAEPEESQYWYESTPELPGWQFNLGCTAPGAFGFWDNANYTAMTGLLASLGSMDYDLSNVKDGTVNVTIEAASPGNGMVMGLLTYDESENKYVVASAYAPAENVPEDYDTYTFSLTGATANSQFLLMTRTENNADGALLIRKLQISAVADQNGTVGMPVGNVQTAATTASIDHEIENGVTYSAIVVPYLVDDNGYILAVGQASEPAVWKADISGIETVVASDNADHVIYFNLQGQKIDNPVKGSTVIRVSGSSATKVIF